LLNSNNTMVSPGILLQQRDAWLVQEKDTEGKWGGLCMWLIAHICSIFIFSFWT
jgi:hypothetical protein